VPRWGLAGVNTVNIHDDLDAFKDLCVYLKGYAEFTADATGYRDISRF
jgi:hypothetical protein